MTPFVDSEWDAMVPVAADGRDFPGKKPCAGEIFVPGA